MPRDAAVRRRLEAAITGFSLSARGVQRVLGVARSIAWLRGAEQADATDLEEALSYRAPLALR